MCVQDQTQSPAEAARSIAVAFFDRYSAHDVEGMTALCSVDAEFDYVPLELWGKQRVQRARGLARGTGKVIWQGLVSSFPDLSLAVRTMAANDVGDVVVEVDVEGTQERPWGLVASAGRHYAEPHLFVLHVTKDDLIDRITAYWNDASVHRQLGHEEVD